MPLYLQNAGTLITHWAALSTRSVRCTGGVKTTMLRDVCVKGLYVMSRSIFPRQLDVGAVNDVTPAFTAFQCNKSENRHFVRPL